MTSPYQRYQGFWPHKMDPKFRVAIPASWRQELGSTLHVMCSRQYDMPVIRVLTQEAYDLKVDLVLNSDKTPAEKERILGKLANLSRPCVVNDQGKLLVPKEFSLVAGLSADGEAIMVGRGNFFQIWNRQNFTQMFDIESQPEAEDDLGIF